MSRALDLALEAYRVNAKWLDEKRQAEQVATAACEAATRALANATQQRQWAEDHLSKSQEHYLHISRLTDEEVAEWERRANVDEAGHGG